MELETLAIRAGADPDPTTGSVTPPIHLSTNFIHGPASEETYGYTYIRDKNPTQDRLEAALSALEGGEDARIFFGHGRDLRVFSITAAGIARDYS